MTKLQFTRLVVFLFLGIGFFRSDLGHSAQKIRLTPFVSGLKQPTDAAFRPDAPSHLWVLEKANGLRWIDTTASPQKPKTVLSFKVRDSSEQGFLSFAFHPQFQSNRKVYLHYNPITTKLPVTRISEWQFDPKTSSLKNERVLFETRQPYSNHNGGQIAFGPDGFLYIGLGDGGFANDPHDYGQNLKSYLGKILRIDVNLSGGWGLKYGIPATNPYKKNKASFPEIYASGFRNPWKFSFSPDGRLIVADVGQDKWEEVSIVEKGKNYGWRIREGRQCFTPLTCEKLKKEKKLVDPFAVYPHPIGQSITGGFVYTGKKVKKLIGKYVFADFVTGKIWMVELPPKSQPDKQMRIELLGDWPHLFSTFARSPDGELYIADFKQGQLFQIENLPQ